MASLVRTWQLHFTYVQHVCQAGAIPCFIHQLDDCTVFTSTTLCITVCHNQRRIKVV